MILGASSYLGKKFSECLVKKHFVTGTYRNIPEKTNGMKAVASDLKIIQNALQEEKYDWIINCAAVYERRNTAKCKIVDANLFFGLRVLDCAIDCGVKNFLTIDTGLPKDLNLYSFTKKQFAEFGRFYSTKYGITFINVLLEMFYGEDEPEGRFLSDVCRKIVRGEEVNLTEGKQKRDIIYIDDVCRALLLLLDSDLTGFWNVPLGCGEAIEIRKVIKFMHEVTKSCSSLYFGRVPMREGEPDCAADITLLRKLGFKPLYPWEKGLKQLCDKIMRIQK